MDRELEKLKGIKACYRDGCTKIFLSDFAYY